MCPSFTFGTNGAHGSVSFGPNQGMVRKPNIAITRGKITRWRTRFEYPSFAFGTDGARSSVSFRPNQGMVRKSNIIITRGKITS